MTYLEFINNGGEIFPKDMYLVRHTSITKINYGEPL